MILRPRLGDGGSKPIRIKWRESNQLTILLLHADGILGNLHHILIAGHIYVEQNSNELLILV